MKYMHTFLTSDLEIGHSNPVQSLEHLQKAWLW